MDNKSKLAIGILGIIVSILVFHPTDVQAGGPSLQISGIVISQAVISSGSTINMTATANVNDTSIIIAPSITYSWSSTGGSFGCATCSTTTWTAPTVTSAISYTINIVASAAGYSDGTSSIIITVMPTVPTPNPPITSPPPVIAGHYRDNVVQNGNIKRIYLNSSDFGTHSDVGVDQLRYWRIMRVSQLDDAIQSLPDSNFTSPATTSRATLTGDVATLYSYMQDDKFHFAILKLESMKKRMDGFEGGVSTDDLIIDSTAQKELLPLLDGLIHVMELAAQPSDNVDAPTAVISSSSSNGPTSTPPPISMQDILNTTVGAIPTWGHVAIATSIIAVFAIAIYRIKVLQPA